MSAARIHKLPVRYLIAGVLLLVLLLLWRPHFASAAACTAPSTDYGNVSGLSVTLPATTTYRIWTRMAAADTTNNTYLLEIDGSSCYTVGGAGVPTYASGATTYFANNSTNWISKTNTGTQIDVSLTAGVHTLKLIGNAPNVVVDRVILTQDTTCVPTGTGDNCANPPDTTPPVVSITSPADGATVSTTTTVTANATDNVAVSKVEFYVDGVLKSTTTTSPYTYSLVPSAYPIGSHAITAKAYDAAGNVATSAVVNVTVPDTIAPTVSITSPAAGTSVSGTFVAQATAADNVGVAKVEFYLDGVLKTTDTTGPSPYSGSISLTGVAAGTHSLTAKAYDAAGNVTTSAAVSLTVAAAPPVDTTPPTVAVTAPTAAEILSNDLSNAHFNSSAYLLTATAADASGIKSVVFKVDGTAVGTPATTSPYTASLDLTKLSCGAHTVTATATDNSANANSATSATVSFNVTYAEDVNATPDCHINYLDLSVIASKYNQTTNLGRADINQDGIVNYLDLSALASKYNSH